MSHQGALLIAQEIIVCCTELRDYEDVPGRCITFMYMLPPFSSLARIWLFASFCCSDMARIEQWPESGIVVQWLRNYFFQCTNEEADLNEKRLRALLAMHQDPSAGNRQIDPWAHLQRYGSSAAFIFFGYVLGCSLPLQISFMPVKTSQINNR